MSENLFLLNDQSIGWLETFAVPKWVHQTLAQWPHQVLLTYVQFEALVNTHLARLNEQQQARVFEAAALSAYHHQTAMPIVLLLLSDDAPQFQFITAEQALCWVHEGRHYKKLTPFLDYHRQLLADFRTKFWAFYHKLQRYRASPWPQQAIVLSHAFDAPCSAP